MKKIFILILCFATLNGFSQSQPKTAYEKRKEELAIQLLKQLGVTQAEINRAKDKDMGGIESLFMVGNFLKRLNTMEGLVAMERFNTAVKKAESLKTEVDFRREREKKALEEKNRQIALDKAKEKERLEEAERLEKRQKEEAQEKEQQRQEEIREEARRKQEKYERSDFVEIKNEIKNKFSKWLEKGEFEKTEDYQNRIKNSAQETFENITLKVITSSIKRRDNRYSFNPDLSKYDADNESFTISLNINGNSLSDVVKVPIKEAASFKENFNQYKVSTKEKNWCFVDNYLYPSTVFFTLAENNTSFEFKLPLKDKSLISFSTQDLGLNQVEVKDIYFNYSSYLDNKEKADSLAFENLFLTTKTQVDNNNFEEAKANIRNAKAIKRDERFEKLEVLIPIKMDSIAKAKRIEYLTALVNEYDSLTKVFPQNFENLEKGVFKKFKYVALGFNYYKDNIVKYLGVTMTEKMKDDYVQSAINNSYNEQIIKDGLQAVRKLINAQEKLIKLEDDKLKEINSNLKKLKERDTDFHWEVKKTFD